MQATEIFDMKDREKSYSWYLETKVQSPAVAAEAAPRAPLCLAPISTTLTKAEKNKLKNAARGQRRKNAHKSQQEQSTQGEVS
jgi:hypothetical protein